jgi:hypothetical protein
MMGGGGSDAFGRLKTAAIGAACGGFAACFYLTVTLGGSGALILVYMTQLPLFVAGLWLGASAAVTAGLTGALVLLAASDLAGAALFAALNAAPVALLVRQALLARRRSSDGALTWYPPGLLTAWLTGFALAGVAAALLLFGGPESLHAALRMAVGDALDRLAFEPIPHQAEIAAALAAVLPGLVAASWMTTTIVNAALAQGLLARFGANWRPSPTLAAVALPIWLPIALGLAAVAALLFPGGARFVGVNVIIALSVPFCLAGLAVLHTAARRLPQPAMALTCFYAVAGVLGWPFVIVAILGVLESWLGLRRRLAPQGVAIDG